MEYALSYKFIWVDYTNHKGERRIRQIMPLQLVFGATPYHSPQQWLLECVDVEDGHKIKMFAFTGIHGMDPDKSKLEVVVHINGPKDDDTADHDPLKPDIGGQG